MARIFIATGEELETNANVFDTIDLQDNWVQMFGMYGGEPAENWQIPPKTGLGCYRLWDVNDAANVNFADHPTEIYMGFWLYVPSSLVANTFLLYIYTEASPPGNYLGLRITGTGMLEAMLDGTSLAISATGLTSGGWQHIQVYAKPLNTGGSFIVKLDDMEVINYSGDTTNDQEYISAVRFSAISNNYPTGFDDIAINDTAGSENNSWPGMARFLPIRPTAAGNSTQLSRAGVDLGANHRQASKLGEMALLQGATTGLKDTYAMDVPDLPTGATIKNVIAMVNADVGAGSGSIKPTIRSGTSESQSAAQALTSARAMYFHCLAANPADAAAWEEADLANLEIGVETA